MAQMTQVILLATALTAALTASGGTARAQAPDFPPEVADGKAVDAFKKYWHAFEAHEDTILKDGEKRFKQSWDEVKQGYQKAHATISAAQLAALQKSAATYRKHLESHPDAENRPYVMLNLAQILSLIGDHLAKEDPNSGTFARTEALALLRDISEGFKDFPYREQALYLRAGIFEALGEDDDALAAWQALAVTAKGTLYGVHARAAVGDYMFKRERPADAMRSYQTALDLLPKVHADDPDYERLRLDYRLAWAAYRAAELKVVIKAAGELLEPGGKVRSADQRQKIQADAVELIGDALYENNVMTRTKALLRDKKLADFAAAIGLHALKRFNANGIHGEAVDLGEFLIDEQPLAKAAPETLLITADSWNKLGKAPKRLQALEKLALLLPAQSLWRARHKDDLATIRAMEEAAAQAAQAAATVHYDTGLASGNPKEFITAASFYDLLLDHTPNDVQANEWRLRRAHCQYLAGNHDDAAKLYEALKTDYKVDGEILQVASYQLVLTNEKRWRDAFAKAAERGDDPHKDQVALASLTALEKSVDEFAARFPNQSRAVDLLLVGAGANRDMERFDAGSKYWQRVLVSQPSPAQRGLAVRGLVYAALKTGSAGDVVELARRFLKLEDWSALGLGIGNELRGVLSAAALDEGKRLNDSGKVLDAGLLLTQVAEDFPDVPDRDRIFRDGAYMLAIAGDWGRAQHAAEVYFHEGLLKNRADMTYLLARAHEYQIRLHDAAAKYLELGEKYPKHARAGTSLVRAEKLALAEGDYALAAAAAAAQAEHARRDGDRLSAYARASEYAEKDGNAVRALALARKRQRNSRTPAERLRSELLVDRMTYKTGSEQEALDNLSILAKEVERSRGKLAATDYAAIAGEVHFLLGDEAKRKFDDFRLAERSGAPDANVTTKSRYFNDLVTEYDRAAAAGDARWAGEARYQLATTAEAFASEIAAIPARNDEAVTLKSQSRYKNLVDRLQAMAKKYYSNNIVAARKDPARYRDNEWVKKSSLRLTGEMADNPDAKHKEIMPASLQTNLPSEWSL